MRKIVTGIGVLLSLSAATACDRLAQGGSSQTSVAGAAAVSAADQSNEKLDLEVTQRIRQALVAHDGLSMAAQNVIVVTTPGMVTLRGPVPSNEERLAITAIAREFAGDRYVSDQLGVEQP
jgi:osmotically-inducible protein OsmY